MSPKQITPDTEAKRVKVAALLALMSGLFLLACAALLWDTTLSITGFVGWTRSEWIELRPGQIKVISLQEVAMPYRGRTVPKREVVYEIGGQRMRAFVPLVVDWREGWLLPAETFMRYPGRNQLGLGTTSVPLYEYIGRPVFRMVFYEGLAVSGVIMGGLGLLLSWRTWCERKGTDRITLFPARG